MNFTVRNYRRPPGEYRPKGLAEKPLVVRKPKARPSTVIKRVVKGIKEVIGEGYNITTLKAGEEDYLGGTAHKGAIYGEGLPFEWTIILGGSSIYAGEFGNYSTPTEAPIAEALEFAADNGYYFEALTSWAITLYPL